MDGEELRTERLLMRRWRASDLDPFAAMNADPQVMEYFPSTRSRAESAALIGRIEAGFQLHGYGFWAVEARGEGFIGFVGLTPVQPEFPFAPAVEVGWRLARAFWGRGLAFEASSAAVRFGLNDLGLSSLVAYTAAVNRRSRRLAERLGMRRDAAEDFIHPGIAAGQPLAPHVLYRISQRVAAAEGPLGPSAEPRPR